jgi:small subunit ribosomal protein S5
MSEEKKSNTTPSQADSKTQAPRKFGDRRNRGPSGSGSGAGTGTGGGGDGYKRREGSGGPAGRDGGHRNPRDRKPRRRPTEQEWMPRTALGNSIKNGIITSAEEVFQNNYKVREKEVFDTLLPGLKEEVVNISLCQKQTDAGEINKFKATVVVGNEDAFVGISSGKAKEVGIAIRKSIYAAKLKIIPVKRGCGNWECNCGGNHSIPFEVYGRCGSCKVTLKPAAKGTGLVASDAAKIALRLAGIKDCYVYIKGNSRNSENTAKAIVDALKTAYTIMSQADWSK